MDIFEALRSGVDFDELTWLTLGEYLYAIRYAIVKTTSNDVGCETAEDFGITRDGRV